MFNWKRKVDTEEERQKAERIEREIEARKLVTRKEKESKDVYSKKVQDELSLKTLKLGQDFHCHICLVPAQEPTIRSKCTGTEPGPGYGVPGSSTYTDVTDWSVPGDLKKCTKCNEWTCEEHIYKSVCQKCAEKL